METGKHKREKNGKTNNACNNPKGWRDARDTDFTNPDLRPREHRYESHQYNRSKNRKTPAQHVKLGWQQHDLAALASVRHAV